MAKDTQYRNLDDSALVQELAEVKDALFKLRFQNATGQLDNTARLRTVRKDIARIYTVIRERELGIRATPAPVEAPAKAEKKTKKAKAAPKSEDTAAADAETTKEA